MSFADPTAACLPSSAGHPSFPTAGVPALPAPLWARPAPAAPARRHRWRLAAILAVSLAWGSPAAAACGPSPAGSPCAGIGATALPGDDAVPPLAGNPVHLASGNKLLTEVDLPPLPGPLGLEIVRHHNGLHALPGVPPTAIGRGWRLSYDVELAAVGPTVQVLTADGRRLVFRRQAADPATCAGDDPAHGRLVARRTAAGERFDWHLPDGRRLAFDERGRLVQVAAPTGDVLDLQRDAGGRLLRATDPAGRTLVFGWASGADGGFRGLAWIDSPVGRFTFRYGSRGDGAAASLVAVIRPAAEGATVERRYHHEDPRFPTLLTGLSVHGPDGFGGVMTRRLATYRYGEDGRAVETMRGDASAPVHRLAIDRSRPGETRLTDAGGRTTVVRHAVVGGRVVVTGTRGAGCTTCPPSPMDFVHDAEGRVVAEVALDDAGRPWRSRRILRDALGRAVEVRMVEHGPAPGGDRVLAVERLGYDGEARVPTRLERASVVEGRSAVVALERDAQGRPVRLVETGFAPVGTDGRVLPAGLDGRVPARFAADAVPLRRETRFVHDTVGGRSRLVAIDGPLPNGPGGTPADSDVTRLHWDARGDRLVRLERPGGAVAELAHDAAGRVVRLTATTGTTRWTLDPASGRPTVVEQVPPGEAGAVEVVRWRLDAAGDVVEQVAGWRTPQGWHADADARQWRAGWDAAGLPRWRVDAFGGVVRWTHDPDGRLVEERQAHGRIEAVRRFTRDDRGQVVGVFDERGPLWLADGPHEAADADDPPRHARGAPRLRWLHDDFGRVVARIGPDHGERVDRHDEAGRLVERREADGVVVRWVHDLRDRPLERTVAAPDGTASVTRWTWDGDRLVAVDGPVQSERWRHDAAGRPVERRLEVRGVDGGGVRAVQRWRHDAFGRLAGWSLADGTWLRVERNGQGQVVALHRERLETRWLRRWLPDQPLLTELARDGVGPSRAVHGNGLVAQRLRSADGALVRLWLAPVAPAPAPATTAGLADRLGPLLGVGAAAAAGAGSSAGVPEVAATAEPVASVPGRGWLGRPAEPGARLDERYLWDRGGHLLQRESRGDGAVVDRSYLHGTGDQLLQVVERHGTAVVGIERFVHDDGFNRRAAQVRRSDPGAGGLRGAVGPDRSTADDGDADRRDGFVRIDVAAGSHRLVRIDAPSRPSLDGPWRHDAAGRVVAAGTRRLGWDAEGRLDTVHDGERLLVRQAFNHLGERVRRSDADGTVFHLHDDRRRWADVDADGRVRRHWVWLAGQPVAVIDPAVAEGVDDARQGPALWRDLRRLWRAALGATDRVTHLHTDHLGAPVLATGDDGRTRWRAAYDAFGRARVESVDPGFELDLRLPGQHEDRATGLHHNDHRTYDPDTGRYLSPDPLGTPDGPNPYAYVRNAPLGHVDPSGLILFAFDGTGNTPADRTNVWHFAQAYDDFSAFDRARGYTGTSFYVQGPGTQHGPVRNAAEQAVPTTLRSIVYGQMARFESYVDGAVAWHRGRAPGAGRVRIDLDVVGFSRGAAMAREFSNVVADYRRSDRFADAYGGCVDIVQRLLALFDTVLSTHLYADPRGPLRLAVPAEVVHAVHAVALHERRHQFPLESIAADPGQAAAGGSPRRIERGFVGAHADIGGGYDGLPGTAPTGGDLSDLALMWVVQQARAAGVSLRELPPALRRVSSPIVHDPRRLPLWRSFRSMDHDTREVRFHPTPGGRPGATASPPGDRRPQADVRWSHGMGQAGAGRFVIGGWDVQPHDIRTGVADLCAYLAWLRTHYGMAIEPHPGCA